MRTEVLILEQLNRIVGEANVSFDPDSVTDPVYKLSAPIIVTPGNENQVAAILQFASERSIHVVPQGGGTKDACGLCSTPVNIVLSLKNLSGILHHSVGDLIVTVLPGTTLQELQETLAQKGQFLPLDPAWPMQSTLGGIVASNASGPKRALYGSVRDHLIATRIAFSDGKIIRTGAKVVKNVAGYDMNKLFIGAMGTLGVFTELTFKIRPLPTSSGLIMLSATTNKLLELQATLLDSHLEPCAFEFASASSVNELLNINDSAIFILFEDVEPSVNYQIEWVLDTAKRLGMDVLQTYEGLDQTEPIMERLREIVANANDTEEDCTEVGLKLLSTISDVPNITQFLEVLSHREGLDLRYHGGLYTGISHVRLSSNLSHDDSMILSIKNIRTYLEEHGGHAIIEFAPRYIRSAIAVWGNSNEGLDIMRGIKQKFDPTNSLNRGRYAGGI
ncbi:MAG: FAD-binding oxidoreductase [Paenibacillaceae bacterium]